MEQKDNIEQQGELQSNNHEIEKYEKHYSEKGLMNKLSRFAKTAGLKVAYAALLLYYVLRSNQVPPKQKALILGALGYLILPVDLIPDAIPALGFTDDFTALFYAIYNVRRWITDDIKQQAKTKLGEWFDKIDEEELKIL